MFFQPMFIGSLPYIVRIGTASSGFPSHFHHETELMYCLEGSFDAIVNGQKFTVTAGHLLYVCGMLPHEYIEGDNHARLLIEFGPLFLQEHYARLTAYRPEIPVIDCRNEEGICELFEETAGLCREKANDTTGSSELALVGNLYKIGAWLLGCAAKSPHVSAVKQMPGIESALSLIHQRYREPLTVEYAAKLSGYGKSNFCKLFKASVGMSFHAYLNSFRVRNAGYLLTETTASVEEIGERVGLCDTKTFCRVFREMTGMTPGMYRRKKKDEA